jgi:hypothetical protein
MEEAKWLSIIEVVKRVCENKKWVVRIELIMNRQNDLWSTYLLPCLTISLSLYLSHI